LGKESSGIKHRGRNDYSGHSGTERSRTTQLARHLPEVVSQGVSVLGDLASYLPEHIRPFAELLKQFPINFEKWVHATGFPVELYQGDVVANAVLTAVDENGTVLRSDLPAMVISCTCDVQPKQGKFALLAPVIDLELYRANSELQGAALDSHLRDVMANKIANLFFLPAGLKLKASVIDFQQLTAVSIEFLHNNGPKTRLTSLSQPGHYLFLVKLAHHLTRPDAASAQRN
jgi:hypothetical protein